jgi:hypothetical protein
MESVYERLNKFVSYVVEKKDPTIELEIRFGRGANKTASINKSSFFKFINSVPKLSYVYTKDIIYNSAGSTPFTHRTDASDAKTQKQVIDVFKKTKSSSVYNGLDVIKSIKPIKPDSYYQVKTPIFKDIQTSEIRIAIANEERITNVNIGKPSLLRHKFRCYWIDGLWEYAATIVVVEINNTFSVSYEIEIEFKLSKLEKNTSLIVSDILNDLKIRIDNITTLINCDSAGIEDEIRNDAYNSVVTLEKEYLPTLTNAQYTLTDKADGTRQFIYINKSLANAFNPISKIYTPTTIKVKTTLTGTVIDCEFIEKTSDGKPYNVYMAFDLLFYNGVDYRNKSLPIRLNALKKTITQLSNVAAGNSTTGKMFQMKEFYTKDIYTQAKALWTARSRKFKYNLDGLIFTPILGSYISHLPIYKWKDRVSIDVRLYYNHKFNFTEFHAHAVPIIKNGTPINQHKARNGSTYYRSLIRTNDPEYQRLNLVKNGILGVPGKFNSQHLDMEQIVEIEYDPKLRTWIYLRDRNDKDVPNAYRTIISALKAIAANLTIDLVGKLKHTPSIYEMVSDKLASEKSTLDSESARGLNVIDKTSKFFSMYKDIIPSMIGSAKSDICIIGYNEYILSAAIFAGYDTITIIESNLLEIYGSREFEGVLGIYELCEKNNYKPKQTILQQLKTKASQPLVFTSGKKTVVVQSNLPLGKCDTIFVSSLDAVISGVICNTNITNNLKPNFETFIKWVKSALKPNGRLCGFYLSGDKLGKFNGSCLIVKNNKYQHLLKIQLTDPKNKALKVSYAKLWSIKPTTISQFMNPINTPVLHIQLYDEYVNLMFNEHKIKLNINSDSKQSQLSDDIILESTKYFIST